LQPFDWQGLPESVIIGVDEVGRGCLAGPVCAAAVILSTTEESAQFKDSKTLSPEKRKQLALLIETKHRAQLGWASVAEINEVNILRASLLAMRRAVEGLLGRIPDFKAGQVHVLVDGNFSIPGLDGIKQTAIVKGDQRAKPIAAASIFAKVARDEHLHQMAKIYPQYGFAEHKAYGTKQHLQAIAEFGPCPEHRKFFAGVKEHWVDGTSTGSPSRRPSDEVVDRQRLQDRRKKPTDPLRRSRPCGPRPLGSTARV